MKRWIVRGFSHRASAAVRGRVGGELQILLADQLCKPQLLAC